MMDFKIFMEWGFYGMIAGILGYGVYVLNKLLFNIEELNIKIAVIVTKIEHHEHRISKLEDN